MNKLGEKEKKVEIRKPKSEEWEAYRELRLKAVGECPLAFIGSPEEVAELGDEHWKKRIEKSERGDKSFILVAIVDDRMVGMMMLSWKDKLKIKHIGQVGGVYVDPDARGRGVGKKLLANIIDFASKQQLRKLQLGVVSSNPAKNFYEKYGFEQVGVLKEEIFYKQYYDVAQMELYLS